MHLYLILFAVLAALATARVVPPEIAPHSNITDIYNFNATEVEDASFDWSKIAIAATNADGAFDKAVEQGRTLYVAMRSKDSVARWFFKNYPNFAETVQSPFDGDLRAELKQWGYWDDDESSKDIQDECDFDKYHHMKAAFEELGLDTRAKIDGGPNSCFRIDHQDGPNIKRNEDNTLPSMPNQYYDVCGKEYRVRGNTTWTGSVPTMLILSELGDRRHI